MNDLKVFFNTEIVNAGHLSQVGNFGLTPVRYLFKGETIEIKLSSPPGTEYQIDAMPSFRRSKIQFAWDPPHTNMLKTIAAVVLLIPGLFLAIFKLTDYLFADTRRDHRLAKECYTPINRTFGTAEKPIITESQLSIEMDERKQRHQPTDVLTIYGTDTLKIRTTSDIRRLNATRTVLVGGATLVHDSRSQNNSCFSLDRALADRGKWKTSTPEKPSDPLITVTKVASVADALRAPLERKSFWNVFSSHYNGFYEVQNSEPICTH